MEGLARCELDDPVLFLLRGLHILNIFGLSLLEVRATYCSDNLYLGTYYQVTGYEPKRLLTDQTNSSTRRRLPSFAATFIAHNSDDFHCFTII